MIRCIAIDDEPIALSIIQEYCRRSGEISFEGFTSPEEGMARICETDPDIVFLDIEMTSHNGLTLARELPSRSALIFTTAYAEYALEGFNVNAIDFLHKPILYPRFQQAMEKARAWIEKTPKEDQKKDTITLKAGYKTIVIPLETILYIEAMDNYVKVYRKNLPMIISQITMKEVESQLPTDRFMRVHRSFIISLDSIDRFSNRRVYIHSIADPIPVGRTYADAFRRLYPGF